MIHLRATERTSMWRSCVWVCECSASMPFCVTSPWGTKPLFSAFMSPPVHFFSQVHSVIGEKANRISEILTAGNDQSDNGTFLHQYLHGVYRGYEPSGGQQLVVFSVVLRVEVRCMARAEDSTISPCSFERCNTRKIMFHNTMAGMERLQRDLEHIHGLHSLPTCFSHLGPGAPMGCRATRAQQ